MADTWLDDGWHYHRDADNHLSSHLHADHEPGHTHPGKGPAFDVPPEVPDHVLARIVRILDQAEGKA